MRFAIADPPYVGQARKHYGHLGGTEVEHAALISHLITDYPDGWALCCSSPSLQTLLPLCPPDVRVLAWVKPFCSFKPGVNPAYAWEPVIMRGGRPYSRTEPTVRDWLSASITLKRGLAGVKPEAFSYWLFAALNAQPGDELLDLFPGSGAILMAWERWQHMAWHPARCGTAGDERPSAPRQDAQRGLGEACGAPCHPPVSHSPPLAVTTQQPPCARLTSS